jgi:hypothetical protein
MAISDVRTLPMRLQNKQDEHKELNHMEEWPYGESAENEGDIGGRVVLTDPRGKGVPNKEYDSKSCMSRFRKKVLTVLEQGYVPEGRTPCSSSSPSCIQLYITKPATERAWKNIILSEFQWINKNNWDKAIIKHQLHKYQTQVIEGHELAGC